MEGLSPATYCIQETAVPAGYVLDNTVHKFTVDANGLVKNEQGYTMVIENRYIKAEFLKTDKVTDVYKRQGKGRSAVKDDGASGT